jgi:site-specific DNA-cytosine methylase
MNDYLTLSEASALIGKSKETLRRWDREGKLSAVREPMSNYRVYHREQVETLFANFCVNDTTADTVSNQIEAKNDYTVLELFAGAGGLAVGMEKAGLRCVALNSRYNLKDALKKGELFDCNVPKSEGSKYPKSKIDVLDLVPQKGYWRDLPLEIQKEFMGGSFHLGGGKTGIARRIGWDEPCLTLTCCPAQKQTERCHPEETRPFTVREYARIQTFPDNWKFEGSVAQQYKQIGNAVPVNLGKEIGYSIVKFLHQYYSKLKME